jgi:hypothetical protein
VPPWILLTVLVALANVAAFTAVRGRWDRLTVVLVLAAGLGTMVGNVAGGRLAIDVLMVGDFSVLAASVAAQLAMLATLLLATLAPGRETD